MKKTHLKPKIWIYAPGILGVSIAQSLHTMREYKVAQIVQTDEELLDTLSQTHILPDILVFNALKVTAWHFLAAKHLCRFYPDVQMIFIGDFVSDIYLCELLKLGGCAFLPGNATRFQLNRAITDVLNKGLHRNEYLTKAKIDTHFNQLKKQRELGTLYGLTIRETQIMNLKCKKLDNSKIAMILGLKIETIRHHHRNIEKKLTQRGLHSFDTICPLFMSN